MRAVAFTAASVLGGALLAAAQPPGPAGRGPLADSTRFEVASVKPNRSGDGSETIGIPPGRLVMINQPLRELLLYAFDVPSVRLLGIPGWAQERFDIDARFPRGVPQAKWQAMLRNLLVDRFGLVVRVEARPGPALVLKTARRDGRLGPNLRRSAGDCQREGGPARGREPWGPGRAGPACGIRTGGTGGHTYFNAGAAAISALAQTLSAQSGRPVLDRTGLTGPFDIDLEYDVSSLRPLRPAGSSVELPHAAPSIFTAMREQLGLSLESVTAPVDHIVIERVDRPTPD